MYYKTHMLVALTISAIFVVLNIMAVTSGQADSFYLPIHNFISNLI